VFIDEGDAAAEGGVDAGDFEGFEVGADDEQGFGDTFEGEGVVGGHHAGVREGEGGVRVGAGAGGDDGPPELDAGGFGAGDGKFSGTGECGVTLDPFDAEGVAFIFEGGTELVYGVFDPGSELVEVDFGGVEMDAVVLGMLGGGEGVGDGEEGFGGDAAPVEADAAGGGVGIDDGGGDAEFGGAEGGGVAAGAAADDDEISFEGEFTYDHGVLPGEIFCTTETQRAQRGDF